MAFPTLNTNEVLMSLYNMIIGQRTFSDNLGGLDGSLVDKARIEGSAFGDTYLYQSADILRTYKFVPVDASANGTVPDQMNVLQPFVPTKVNQQPITLDIFRQIPITIDRSLSKRAFIDEGAWYDFTNLLSDLLDQTKRVYDVTTYNAYVGTVESSVGKQQATVSIPALEDAASATEQVSHNKLLAETIAEKISNIFTELKDVSKDYNDLGYYRAFAPSDLIVVWNSDYVNKIKTAGLPEIYHSGDLASVFDFENVLPAKYFGKIEVGTESATGGRTLVEAELNDKHYFAGEEIPERSLVEANTSYNVDGDIVCKIIHKDSIPYMSGFVTRTEFINARNMNSSNQYLTFGHNTLTPIKNYPLITLRVEEA
jgi:hypothetical protein